MPIGHALAGAVRFGHIASDSHLLNLVRAVSGSFVGPFHRGPGSPRNHPPPGHSRELRIQFTRAPPVSCGLGHGLGRGGRRQPVDGVGAGAKWICTSSVCAAILMSQWEHGCPGGRRPSAALGPVPASARALRAGLRRPTRNERSKARSLSRALPASGHHSSGPQQSRSAARTPLADGAILSGRAGQQADAELRLHARGVPVGTYPGPRG